MDRHKNYVHYFVSNGAIIGFTRALARELGASNITVNCITPGAILTETEVEKLGTFIMQKEATKKLYTLHTIPKRLKTQCIEGVFTFLASSDSNLITGQTFNVDGGWIMH